MKSKCLVTITLFFLILGEMDANGQRQQLKLIFIRHAEKSDDGDNLDCKGFNRSMLLPAVLFRKFGKPDQVYIPALKEGRKTKHARMLQSITPFAVKYDLNLNSTFNVDDSEGLGTALLEEKGTVLIVWEHQRISPILKRLGISMFNLKWPTGDFDSIWIVTFKNGKPLLTKDRELLNPGSGCPF
jgi:hypothetical protein